MTTTILPQVPYQSVSSNIPSRQVVTSGALAGSFGVGVSQISQQYDIKGTDLVQFCTDVLGYAVKAGSKIHRQIPSCHPSFPYMYASRITGIEGLAPIGNFGSIAGTDSKYKSYRVTIVYETPPYRIARDAQVAFEWERYTIPRIESSAEFIQRQDGSMLYESGTLANKPVGKGGVPMRLVKEKISIEWVQVPDDGLFTQGGFDYGGRPAKIENGLGKVNSAEWHGYPAGTLLFDSWDPQAQTMPILPVQLGTTQPRAWNATLNFIYFEFGHNYVPAPTGGGWVRVYAKGSAPPKYLYDSYNFNLLFDMN